MTSQQRKTIEHIEATHEAERFAADQAAREQATLDELSVIIACQVKINEGNMDAARKLWRDYREGK